MSGLPTSRESMEIPAFAGMTTLQLGRMTMVQLVMPLFGARIFCMLLVLLTLVCTAPVLGDQAPAREIESSVSAETTAETEADAPETDDEAEPKKTKKEKDPNRGRILPIPVFITEPAIGEGFGLVLAYFHRVKGGHEGKMIGSPESIVEKGNAQEPPPTVTGVFGAYTSNDTAITGIGHMNSFKDDHIRFKVAGGIANINSTFYIADQPFKFNLEGSMAYQDTRFRIRDSKWFWGIAASYLDASTAFQVELPEDPPLDFFRSDLTNVGFAGELAWDTRDSTSMPNKGKLFNLAAWRYDDAIGGDYDYWDVRAKWNSFHQLRERFVLGWRVEYSTISGQAPFFAVPFVSLRGIPALRYQGERVGVAEIEGRYNFTPKWAMIGFVGKGWAWSDNPLLDTDQNIRSFGIGGRYKIFEAQNIWVGIDIARGPEDGAWYIQVGQAW